MPELRPVLEDGPCDEGRASAVGLRGGLGARQPASRHQGTGERLAGERRAGGPSMIRPRRLARYAHASGCAYGFRRRLP